MNPGVAAIVLNYNGLADTARCLESLARADGRLRPLVVDNGSDDGAADALATHFPEVTLVRSPVNLGFAGGCNLGLETACAQGADYLLLLNNDTVVAQDFLAPLLELAARPGVGVVGPRVFYTDGRVWSDGGLVDRRTGAVRQLGIGRLPGPPVSRSVDFLPGCALLFSRETYQAVGPFDPRFFMFFEDVDWCLRAGRLGLECWLAPASRVWHSVSGTIGRGSPASVYYMTRNRLLLVRKLRQSRAPAYRVLATELPRQLVSSALRGDRSHSAAVARGALDFLRGRFGPAPARGGGG